MMSLLEIIRSPRRAIRENRTLLKFLMVGLSGLAVNLILLTIFKDLLGNSLILIANGIAVEGSIISNFVWNDRYTFGFGANKVGSEILPEAKKGWTRGGLRLAKYNLVSLVSFAVNELVFFFMNTRGVYYIWASIVAIGCSFIINYVGSSRWAWYGYRNLNSRPVPNAPSVSAK